MRNLTSFRNIGSSLILVSGLLITANTFAQTQSGSFLGGYKQLTRLGTNQAICRPPIQSGEELQSFAVNQRQDVLDVLSNANWEGNPEDVLNAIAAGEFTEKSFPVGSKYEWMGQRKLGKVIASPKRQWAGKEPFEGFELNITSNCVQHTLVIPKACCNLALAQSSPVAVDTPVISVNKEGENVTINVNSFGAAQTTTLTHPDGRVEPLTMTEGAWTGTLPPGNYAVESRTTSDCGESAPVKFTFSVAEPMAAAAAAAPAGGLFLAPFIGRQVRAIDPPLVGLQLGYLIPMSERSSFLVQGGGSYNLKDSELSIFADIGLERKVGENGFVGGGVGLWDINNSDDNISHSDSPKRDVTYFIHGGADTPWSFKERPIQWFGEARIFDDFTDNISEHNVLKLGLRIMQ